MHPKIIKFSEKKVMGFSANFESVFSTRYNGFQIIPSLWDRFLTRLPDISESVDKIYWGICDPLTAIQAQIQSSEYSYMACVEVENFNSIPAGMLTKIIPTGQYAVFTHRGKLDKLEYTLTYIYKEWLIKSGEKQRIGPGSYMERYDERFKIASDDSEIDIYVAIE